MGSYQKSNLANAANNKRDGRESYNGSDLVGSGGIGDASIGYDVVQDGLDELPFLKEVLLEHCLLGAMLVVIFLTHWH